MARIKKGDRVRLTATFYGDAMPIGLEGVAQCDAYGNAAGGNVEFESADGKRWIALGDHLEVVSPSDV